MSEPPSTPFSHPKRRRVDIANSVLRKPFRSPLLSRPPGTSTPAPPVFSLSTPSSNPYTLETPPRSTSSHVTPSKLSDTPTKRPAPSSTNCPAPIPPRIPLRRTPLRRPLFTTNSSSSDPELAATQKKHSALLSEVRAIKESQETVTQALALEANPKSEEDLEESVWKWRLAARSAADTLFGIAGDKVNQLGGPGGDAWRSMMGGGRGGFQSFGWDDNEPKRGRDEDGDEGIGGEDDKKEEGEKNGREEWGMRLMLKTLGIPEKMLGWDNEGACWKNLEEMEGDV